MYIKYISLIVLYSVILYYNIFNCSYSKNRIVSVRVYNFMNHIVKIRYPYDRKSYSVITRYHNIIYALRKDDSTMIIFYASTKYFEFGAGNVFLWFVLFVVNTRAEKNNYIYMPILIYIIYISFPCSHQTRIESKTRFLGLFQLFFFSPVIINIIITKFRFLV